MVVVTNYGSWLIPAPLHDYRRTRGSIRAASLSSRTAVELTSGEGVDSLAVFRARDYCLTRSMTQSMSRGELIV